MFGADKTQFVLQKTFFTHSAHLKKKWDRPSGEGTSQGAAMHGSVGISAGLSSPWGRKGLPRVLVEASFSGLSRCAIPSEGWVN